LPYKTQNQKICIPINKDQGLDSNISSYFARAEKFIFIELYNNKIKDYHIKDNPHKEKKIRAGLNTALFIVKEKINTIIVKEMGPISFHTLRDNIVDMYVGADESVKKNIEKLLKEKLRLLKEPTKEKK